MTHHGQGRPQLLLYVAGEIWPLVMTERKDTQMTAAETAERSAGSPGGASGTAEPGERPFFTSRFVDVTIPPGTLSGCILRRAAALGSKPAVIDAASGFGRGSVLANPAPTSPTTQSCSTGRPWPEAP